MKVTEVLANEHRVIEQVLSCLEKMAKECSEGGGLDAERAKEAIDFFRGFADRCHHAKEEGQLFPVLERKGLGGDCGPVAVMLREHELGRVYVGGMEASVEAAAGGNAEAAKWFAQHAEGYIALLREHIQKEDHCLFPAAESKLDAADVRNILAAFEKVENGDVGTHTHERYLDIANRLADHFGVTRSVRSDEGDSDH